MLWLYLLGVFIISIVILFLYLNEEKKNSRELKRINIIEGRMKHKQEILAEERSKTTPCSVPNLYYPRSCYEESNHKCSWNEKTDRCDSM
jgi:hypothetical protein